jgi:hypothetical protein
MPVGFIAFCAFNIAGYFNRSHDSVVGVANRHVRHDPVHIVREVFEESVHFPTKKVDSHFSPL